MSKANKGRRRKKKSPQDPKAGGKPHRGTEPSSSGALAQGDPSSVRKAISPRGLGILSVFVLLSVLAFSAKPLLLPQRGSLVISYPFDGSLFPPEIVAPTVWWEDGGSDANQWRVLVEFEGGEDPILVDVDTAVWAPDEALWESIKGQTIDSPARLTVSSLVSFAGMSRTLSSHTISISTSSDSVGAPIFFREVPLPFIFATANLPLMKWRLGDIASPERPPVILSDLPSCGNCHSFSADGRMLGMDVDVANDKGAYILTPFEPETLLARERIFSWNDYYPPGGSTRTFGLLARVSPDGRYVVGGMKDRAVFIPRPDLEFSQLFFPVQGLLAFYDRETGAIDLLPGADDDRYVQSNAAWTPDGRSLIFARGDAAHLTTTTREHVASLSLAESAEVVGGEEYLDESTEGYRKFLFDLYTIPFNDGRGGEPVPLEGASGNGKSNFFPKYSPDGKWLVFNQAESFMLLMPDSRLYIMPADGGEPRLMNCNTESMNSWHSWSPNSKWLVFTSKLFSPYTQLFLTHVDENGMDTPPVLLETFRTPERAANIPEFVNIQPGSERRIEERFVDAHTYFRHGLRLEEFGRIEEAQGQYVEALSVDPNDTEARIALGLTYAMQRRFEEAEETISTVPESDPLFGRVPYMRGGILAEQGQFAAANEEFRRSISIGFPDPYMEANVQLDLGLSCLLMEDYRGAVEAFQTALRIDPEKHDALIHLGNIKLRQGDTEGAIRDFERALEMAPTLEGLAERIGQLRAQVEG